MRSTFLDTGSFLDLSTLNKTGEVLEGAVIGGFRLLGKSTAGQLPHPEMIGDALTAYPFSRARIISAVASGQVLFFVTFHRLSLLHGHIFLCLDLFPGVWSPALRQAS